MSKLDFYQQINNRARRAWPLMLLLLLLLVLRLPNFSEPYWYGDEGIYLTIGQALNKGYRLYSEIVDHKTPLIYVFAQTGSQLYFRLLLVFWMVVATAGFYRLAYLLFPGKRLTVFLTSLIFVIFTTIPWFEGNIPNGELFVMGFVLVATILLGKTAYFRDLLSENKEAIGFDRKEALWLLGAGTALGLGILTKVPALFDAGAILTAGYFTVTNRFSPRLTNKRFLAALKLTGLRLGLIIAGIFLPILLSVVYFWAVGSGQDYLQFGLLYNLHYAGNWELDFNNTILNGLFTLPGKFVVAASGVFAITFLRKYVKPRTQFIFAWFMLAMFASLLSNRPYPHYFLQVIPPLALMVGIPLTELTEKKKKLSGLLQAVIVPVVSLGLFISVLTLLKVGLYPVAAYYQNWLSLLSGRISAQEYRQLFNPVMTDNYEAAALIKSSGADTIFIWGTNPMLYALSGATPTSRFTVSFHIQDLNAYEETLRDFIADSPKYAVVMRNENDKFPEFFAYLYGNYQLFQEYDNFTLWRRLNPPK